MTTESEQETKKDTKGMEIIKFSLCSAILAAILVIGVDVLAKVLIGVVIAVLVYHILKIGIPWVKDIKMAKKGKKNKED
jgi:Zn-dependent M16 (insulinase) family peptidase